MTSALILKLTLVLWLVWPAAQVARAEESLSEGEGDLRVMTYNVDEGTDYLQILAATNQTQFLLAVGQTITQVRATNPPARMQAVASQIIAAGPALVSLQELDQWSTGSFDPVSGACGPMAIEFDMLRELLGALTAQGAHYQIASLANQLATPPAPGLILPSTFLCLQVVNHVAILARTDLHPSKFQWGNPQSAQYANKVVLPTPLGVIPSPRAWVAVDAQFNRKAFRLIGTHFESVVSNIRQLQAGELRTGPAKTLLPVVIAMDSNAQAFPQPQDPAYVDFLAAGYRDAWTEIFPHKTGFTCCQAQLVNNPASQLNQRIDLILTLGRVEAQDIALFGDDSSSRTPGGLWPSDHAGVAAQLKVERE
jgi:hypothetical protein